ncbi:glycogen debranching N-terminal domain-containing protein [Deinococcus pimensis]|uniref:amylo-alpha-1,6-glucosidase n=1 Tax=Deinococcus pimensis TaxID=309888 RepID=UPI0004B167B4|nr:glycogen debranching N-terminal domain-containing protein [Deinococcus pimensis]
MLSSRGVLKENELYWVGDGQYVVTEGEAGLYRRDTRFLSLYEWQLDGERPQPLVQHLRYPWWLHEVSGNANLGYTMHTGLERDLTLTGAALHDRVRVTRYRDVARELRLRLAADFKDMFEVRGWPAQPPRDVRVTSGEGRVEFTYTAQDGLVVRALVETSPPARWDGEALVWDVTGDLDVSVTVHALQGDESPREADVAAIEQDYARWTPATTLADARDTEVLTRSLQDLRSLLFWTPQGPFPAAGIPWFVAPFGRDSLIMAHLLLPHHPEVALGVARYLAARQGVKHDDVTLEEPGKILHEERNGELTRTGRTQHRPYYGTVDATPLFVWLCGELAKRDPAVGAELAPHWQAALTWMETIGDADGDLLLEYTPDEDGIRNQVWKDSGDSTFFETGEDAEGHIAVVEVQGYAYAAYLAGADLYEAAGDAGRAAHYRDLAGRLRAVFHEKFWWPERGTYVHGLGGDKRPMRVLVSNAPHTLWTGIVPEEHAASVTAVALSEELWTGWGIRTLGAREPRYNPVSYHNGSVWPHDTALAALGMARYGLTEEAGRVARALYDAARWAADARLPELFAGFEREDGPPVPYPAACHPQGWDAVLPVALAHLLPAQEAARAAAD